MLIVDNETHNSESWDSGLHFNRTIQYWLSKEIDGFYFLIEIQRHKNLWNYK